MTGLVETAWNAAKDYELIRRNPRSLLMAAGPKVETTAGRKAAGGMEDEGMVSGQTDGLDKELRIQALFPQRFTKKIWL